MHHYITKYRENGELIVEAWIQINIFRWCFCLAKRKLVIIEDD